MSILNSHESVPVQIGGFTMYCEKFKATGTKAFSEQNTVSGNEVITNSGKKAVRIILSGRICGENYMDFPVNVNNLMYSTEKFSTEYKNTVFGQCQVQSFVVDDQNNDFITVTVNLIATGISTKNSEVS